MVLLREPQTAGVYLLLNLAVVCSVLAPSKNLDNAWLCGRNSETRISISKTLHRLEELTPFFPGLAFSNVSVHVCMCT